MSALRAVGLLLAAVLLAGCTPRTQDAAPPDPTPIADALVTGLTTGDISAIPAEVDAQAEFEAILSGMDGFTPQVTRGDVRRVGATAEIPLHYSWPFPVAAWVYSSTGALHWDGTQWTLNWTAGMIHPELTSQTRLVHTQQPANRGRITDTHHVTIAEQRQVIRIGIEKSRVTPDQVEESARQLAEALGINADNYVQKVRQHGPVAFVEAIALRHDAPQPENWRRVPGAIGLLERRTLAAHRQLAPEIIGGMGRATEEQVRQGILVGDEIGTSGLQRRHDAVLRGKAGAVVRLSPRERPVVAPGATATPTPPRPVLFEADPEPGQDLTTTLDIGMQLRAEQVLDSVPGTAAIVAVRPNTGQLVTAAISPGAGANPEATYGHFQPGGVFQPVPVLALLRTGMTPDTPVTCAESVTIAGRTFTNRTGYPTDKLGRISFREAVEHWCATALVSEHERIPTDSLRSAAGSLGFGLDYEAGFTSYFGTIPERADQVAALEALVGRGGVEASPMAIAGIGASIVSGRTVRPHLIEGYAAPEPAVPLTAAEAAMLREMVGDSRAGAGSGPQRWLLNMADDLVVVVLVSEGTPEPVLRAFLG